MRQNIKFMCLKSEYCTTNTVGMISLYAHLHYSIELIRHIAFNIYIYILFFVRNVWPI